jgi:phytoene dehydrogenase-like protein
MTAGGTGKTDFDVIVLGAGHNGLVCAAYLARAGLRVLAVERRGIVGGAAVTEEFHPGFRNSVCAYVVSLLSPKVVSELGLAGHGLDVIARPLASFAPRPDGGYLALPRDVAGAQREIARHSPRDAESYAGFDAAIVRAAAALRSLLAETPANLGGGARDLLALLRAGNRVRRLGFGGQTAFAELMTASVGDYLDSWFESDALKGLFGYEGIIGNLVSPYQAGSAYLLLHHAFGELDGTAGAWGYPRGGMGAVSQAIARAAEGFGAHIRVGAPVAEVIVENGAAMGVVLADGTAIRARAVAAAVNPRLLFLDLLDSGALEPEFRRRMEGWRCRSGTFRMNVALGELPDFTSLPGRRAAPHHSASIDIAPSLAYLEHAYDDAKSGGWSREPVISLCIPSTLDDSLAPPGQHVASLFCQHFHPELSGGRSWDEVRDEAADLVIDTVTRYAPNFRDAVIARQILTPLDLEREFGLVGGDIFHGAMHLDQLYSLRPAAGHADYRMPVRNLYLCGAGAHPGGGVTGYPGHNAAREIIRDFRRKRLAPV